METETTDDLIMAGFIGSPIWAVVDHTTSSALHSDAEDDDDNDDDDDDQGEALSFCDLAIYGDNSSSHQYHPNQHSTGGGDPQDHDFEFAPCGSQVRTAEDLFYKGRLLPLLPRRAAEIEYPALDCDLAAFRKSYSCKENRSAAALPAKVRTWRMNSLDSHTSRGFGFGRGFSRSSSRASGAASASAPATTRKPAAKVGSAARAPPKPAKSSSLKWQFFTLGLMKTPPMRLDDIRLRQGRPSNADRSSSSCVSEFSVSGSVLRRTVSCSSQDDVVTPATAPSLAAGKAKSKSVKENFFCSAEPETARTSSSSSSSKAWRMLKPLTALNGCRASTTSVVNCSSSTTTRKQAPRSHDGFTNQNNNNNNAKLVSLSRLSEPHQQHRHDRPPLFCKISA